MGEEKLRLVHPAVFQAVSGVSEAGGLDFSFLPVSIHEHTDAIFRCASTRLIQQDGYVVELHIAGDPRMLFALGLTGLFLFVREQSGREVNRVGIGTGDHLVQAINKALSVRLRLGHSLIDINVHDDLIAGFADVLRPGTYVVGVNRARVIGADILAIYHRVRQRHQLAFHRLVAVVNLLRRVQAAIHHDVIDDRNRTTNDVVFLAVDGGR
ncbi:Uncharacterised protein [Enterobacter hormaechei]|nr:Uncharacterised protein [Enterobacter hormaechei]